MVLFSVSDNLALHTELWVLPVRREKVKIVLIHSWPTKLDAATIVRAGLGVIIVEVLDIQLSGKHLPHAG